jgi:predicted component of type VI protein secretion system
MAKVAILHNNIDKTRNYVLQRENVLGRAADCTVFCDNPRVSRRHARIACIPRTDHYFIEDISARGTFVNFKRLRGRHPLKEADRICVLTFHNVHPVELDRMTPEVLKGCVDDPRNRNIQAAVDLTFGYVDAAEAQPAPAPGTAAPTAEEPQGLLERIKSLLRRSPPKPEARPVPKLEPKLEPKLQPKLEPKPQPKPEPKAEKPTKEKDAAWKSSRPARYKI